MVFGQGLLGRLFMRRMMLVMLGVLTFLPVVAFADPIQPVLNDVIYQTTAEQWVTTQTAEVIVDVNATLNEEQLADAHTDILSKLDELAKSDWHITQFNRNPNESGLEQLLVEAQTRLPETALSDLREKAKKLSKPGETITIQNIAFEPTTAEIEAVRAQLRTQIYTQVQNELAQLNKMYPNQHYAIHQLSFNGNGPTPQPMLQKAVMAMAERSSDNAMPVTVQNKLMMTANVDLAAVNQ
jgi:hypothetical protein